MSEMNYESIVNYLIRGGGGGGGDRGLIFTLIIHIPRRKEVFFMINPCGKFHTRKNVEFNEQQLKINE